MFIKDIPNTQFIHVENPLNENKPACQGRDCTEIFPKVGEKMLLMFQGFRSTTKLFDDFKFYDEQEKFRHLKKQTSIFTHQGLKASKPRPPAAVPMAAKFQKVFNEARTSPAPIDVLFATMGEEDRRFYDNFQKAPEGALPFGPKRPDQILELKDGPSLKKLKSAAKEEKPTSEPVA